MLSFLTNISAVQKAANDFDQVHGFGGPQCGYPWEPLLLNFSFLLSPHPLSSLDLGCKGVEIK